MEHIGIMLRHERENKQLTLEEVSVATKIKTAYLRALEEGSFHTIPGEIYLKGFLKIYGNFLGLKGQDLVEEYKQRKVNDSHLEIQFDEEKKGFFSSVYKAIFG